MAETAANFVDLPRVPLMFVMPPLNAYRRPAVAEEGDRPVENGARTAGKKRKRTNGDEHEDERLGWLMLGPLFDILRKPFLELSGTPVSALSVLTALLVVFVAHLISRVLARSLSKAFHHHPGVGFTVGKITRWAGMVVGVLIALTTVGLNMSAVFAAMAVLLVGIGFGLQKMAENFISGLILLIERPLSIGDFVQVDAFKGTVKDIGLRATKIETEEGLTHLIPNGELITKTVTNYSQPAQSVEIAVQVGVSYDADLTLVRRALLEIAAASPLLCKTPAPEVRHQGFGDSSINLALEAWIERAHEDDDTKSDLRFAIAAKFTELGIEIPYPQRDVRMRKQGSGG